MTSYICIEDDEHLFTYLVDTDEQRLVAIDALRVAGLTEAPIYIGEPDGLGDSYKTGDLLFVPAAPTEDDPAVAAADLDAAVGMILDALDGGGLASRVAVAVEQLSAQAPRTAEALRRLLPALQRPVAEEWAEDPPRQPRKAGGGL